MLRTQLKQLNFTATVFSLSGNSFFMHKYTYVSDMYMCVCCVCICVQGHTRTQGPEKDIKCPSLSLSTLFL